MSITRLTIPGTTISAGAVRVPPESAHHAKVTRVTVGEAVELLDLAGTVGFGRVARWEGGTCWVDVERVERGRGEPPAPLVLGLAVLHTQAFDWAVEKATELGVTSVVPVFSSFTQGGKLTRRTARWRRVAAAAVAQCGRSRMPVVAEPMRLENFLAASHGARLVADPTAVQRPTRLQVSADGVTVLVGPEGGFAGDELGSIYAAGFVGLPLGPRTLRAETAAVVALTLAQKLAGWLG